MPLYSRIYLIDHAWTYQVNDARVQLQMIPGLVERMAALMRVENEEQDKEQIIENILTEMWKLVYGCFETSKDKLEKRNEIHIVILMGYLEYCTLLTFVSSDIYILIL